MYCLFAKPFSQLTPHELYEVLALRQRVFIVEQTCYYLDNDGKDIDAWHLWLTTPTDDAMPVACTRLLPKGIAYAEYASIGRVCNDAAYRRHGVGRLLMQLSIEVLYALWGKQPIKIGAQCYLTDFYGSFGFVPIGDVYMEDNIPHIAMLRK